MIHLLFTGGTISMHRDQAAGGNIPTHGGEALVGFAEGIERISPYRIENWAMLPACHMGLDRLWALRQRVKEIADSGVVKGIVVTHGTDTLEETAYLLDRTLEPRLPVAMTGAMRTSSDERWDGPRNLLDAAAVAASGKSAGRGTMVVFHGKVLAGATAVKTHATDTLEETAYLLDRTLEPSLPVVMTGAMRTSSDEGWDGPRNLLDAAAVAASGKSAGRGAMVVFHGKVLAGATAVKTHATDPDAFSAPHSTPLGRVDQGQVAYDAGKRGGSPLGGWEAGKPIDPSSLSARVALVPMMVGDQGKMLDLARPDHDGVVIVAFGSGNLPPGAVPAISRWIDDGKPVVLASRCPAGVVTPLYAFDGGGARLVALGAIPAGPRTPSQAWMELTISLSAGTVYGG